MTKAPYKILTRRQAIKRGLKKYFTGRKCINGHLSKKYTYNAMCISCGIEWVALNPEKVRKSRRQWENKNRDKVRAYNRRWNAENPEKYNAAIADWHRRNPEKDKATKFRWLHKNRKKHNASGLRWQKNNRDKARVIKQRRRAKEIGARGSHTDADIRRIYFRQRGRCAGCRCKLTTGHHLDHRVPLCRGGSNYPRNLQLLCVSCNTSKSFRTMREWRTYQKKMSRLLTMKG